MISRRGPDSRDIHLPPAVTTTSTVTSTKPHPHPPKRSQNSRTRPRRKQHDPERAVPLLLSSRHSLLLQCARQLMLQPGLNARFVDDEFADGDLPRAREGWIRERFWDHVAVLFAC